MIVLNAIRLATSATRFLRSLETVKVRRTALASGPQFGVVFTTGNGEAGQTAAASSAISQITKQQSRLLIFINMLVTQKIEHEGKMLKQFGKKMSPEELTSFLKEFETDLRACFSLEEEYMNKYKYPEAVMHKTQHLFLVASFMNICQREDLIDQDKIKESLGDYAERLGKHFRQKGLIDYLQKAID